MHDFDNTKFEIWSFCASQNCHLYRPQFNPLSTNPQNDLTHSNNSLAKADELFECVWPCYGVGTCRVNNQISLTKNQLIYCFNFLTRDNQASIYLFNVNNGNISTMCEICSKLTIKTSERCQWRRSSVFNVSFEQVSHIFLVSPLTRNEVAEHVINLVMQFFLKTFSVLKLKKCREIKSWWYHLFFLF